LQETVAGGPIPPELSSGHLGRGNPVGGVTSLSK
jgi:hypothetical protein